MPVYAISYKDNGYGFPGGWITPFIVGDYAKLQDEFTTTDSAGADNIAHLNPYFGELTAHYWVWRNKDRRSASGDGHIGFCHYRRYFNLLPHEHFQADKLLVSPSADVLAHLGCHEQQVRASAILNHFDIIAARQSALPMTIRQQFIAMHDEAVWQQFLDSIMAISPGWLKAHIGLFEVSCEFRFYPIFITRWELFVEWCELIFPVLFDVFAKIGPLPEQQDARFQPRRYPAYLSERFFMLYLHARALRVYGTQVVCFEDDA